MEAFRISEKFDNKDKINVRLYKIHDYKRNLSNKL